MDEKILLFIKNHHFCEILSNLRDCNGHQNVLIDYSYLLKRFEYYCDAKQLDKTTAVDEAIKDCRKNGYLTNCVDREEFMTMVVRHWTIEELLEDERCWSLEQIAEAKVKAEASAKAKAEAKVEIVKLESAKKFLAMGLAVEDIAIGLGLEVEIINDLICKNDFEESRFLNEQKR